MADVRRMQTGKPSAAAIYVRISDDSEGTGAGVARQEADCRELAERLGWTVADVYPDNDVSAYKSKPRPQYQRMLADIRDGVIDSVLIYHPDRLTRRLRDMLDFLDVVEPARVPVRFVSGGSDLGTEDGLFMIKMMAMLAENESASKSRRVLRKMAENAKEGKLHGGGRPYGYKADRITIDKPEAAIIRKLVKQFLAGESIRDLASWLQQNQIPTARGGRWQSGNVRHVLRSGRIAGLREHRGEVTGEAVWEGIITPSQRDDVIALMDSKKRAGRRAVRSYLLSGLLRCGKCGGRLYASARTVGVDQRVRRYVCMSGPDHGGCGKLTVVAEPLEAAVTNRVIWAMDSPELADLIAGRAAADAETAALRGEQSADAAQLDELARAYASKAITMTEWMAAREPIQNRVSDRDRRISRVMNLDALSGYLGHGSKLEIDWAGLPLARQAAIVSAVLDHAVIKPGTLGARSLDRERIELVWRR